MGEDQTNILGASYITPADSLKHKCLSFFFFFYFFLSFFFFSLYFSFFNLREGI